MAGRRPADPQHDRNDFSGRRDRHFRMYVTAVVLCGGAVLGTAVRSLDAASLLELEPAFWVLCALLLAAEVRPLFTAGARDANGLVLSTSFVFALMLRYGLPIALLVQAMATAVADLSVRKAPWRTAFNIGQYSLSWGAAALAMKLAGHEASTSAPVDPMGADLAAAGVGGLTYFAANQLLVSVAVSLKTGRPLLRMLREDVAYESVTNGVLLALSPLVVLVVERGSAVLPLLLPPLAAVYRVASIALEREQQALTDALTGLPNRTMLTARAAESSSKRARRARRCCCSTWTVSRRSTTRSATTSATASCRSWRAGCPRRCDPKTRSSGWAVMSSRSCCPAPVPTPPRRPRAACSTASGPRSCSTGWRSTWTPASASPSRPSTARTSTRSCSTPTSRCTSPRRPAAASSSTTPAATATPPRGWSCWATCAARSPSAKWRSTTNRRRSSSPAGSPVWRRSCAGGTPSADWSSRTTSSRSSLDHLRRRPVQELKVDRSFVQRICTDARDAAIVRSIVDLGVGLGMRVVAEGVEDEPTWLLLREMGCDMAQGWLLSRAEPAAALTPWLLERQAEQAERLATLRR